VVSSEVPSPRRVTAGVCVHKEPGRWREMRPGVPLGNGGVGQGEVDITSYPSECGTSAVHKSRQEHPFRGGVPQRLRPEKSKRLHLCETYARSAKYIQ
jgi:hypothetical protein